MLHYPTNELSLDNDYDYNTTGMDNDDYINSDRDTNFANLEADSIESDTFYIANHQSDLY